MHRTNFSLLLLLLLVPWLIAVASSSYYSNGNEGEGSTAGSLASPTNVWTIVIIGGKKSKDLYFLSFNFWIALHQIEQRCKKNHCVRNAKRPVIIMVVVRLVVTVTKLMKTKL